MKTAKDVATALIAKLEGQNLVTIPADDLYDLADRKRIRGSFMEQLKSEVEEIGYVMASGDKIIAIMHDANFAPTRK